MSSIPELDKPTLVMIQENLVGLLNNKSLKCRCILSTFHLLSNLSFHKSMLPAGQSSRKIVLIKGRIENCDGLPSYSHGPVTPCE